MYSRKKFKRCLLIILQPKKTRSRVQKRVCMYINPATLQIPQKTHELLTQLEQFSRFCTSCFQVWILKRATSCSAGSRLAENGRISNFCWTKLSIRLSLGTPKCRMGSSENDERTGEFKGGFFRLFLILKFEEVLCPILNSLFRVPYTVITVTCSGGWVTRVTRIFQFSRGIRAWINKCVK